MTIDFGLAALAFSAGMASFFSPCATAMLPAFASLYLGSGNQSVGFYRRLSKGVIFGLVATLGFVALYVSAGTIISVAGRQVASFIPYLSVLIGLALAVIGVSMLVGKSIMLPSLPLISSISVSTGSEMTTKNVFGYGLVFGTTSLGCTLPIFLSVVIASLASGGIYNGVFTFFLYALGKGLLMTFFTTSLAVSKEVIVNKMNYWLPKMKKLSSVILIVAGSYVVYYDLKIILQVF
jgi:cytochrome c biogenesis protein CcdA